MNDDEVFIFQRINAVQLRWLSFLFGGLVAVNLGVNIVVSYAWIGSFDVRSLNSCKCVARWILCHYWLLKEIVWLFRG